MSESTGGKTGTDIIISDMSHCKPKSAISKRETRNRWQLLAYRTYEGEPQSGLLLGAPSYVTAPEVTLPLNVTGWHSVSIGFWIPRHDYDGATTIKVKLDNDPCFSRISEPEPVFGAQPKDGASLLKEAHFKTADLTGRRLVFAKIGGLFAQKAYIAYIRLTPLDADAVRVLQADRARADTRTVQATIDGISYLSAHEYLSRKHILELVEPYRNTDVGKVTWAFCYGDITNYPSKVGKYLAGGTKIEKSFVLANNTYKMGCQMIRDTLKRLEKKKIIPQAVVAEHVHEMGLKFEAMFRLGMPGHIPPPRECLSGQMDSCFVEKHPQFRLCMADGTPVEKASYAFPEVRALMLGIIREAAEIFDIDGASLAFCRGPVLVAWEKPVLDDFRKEFKADARKLPLDDPRLLQIRYRYLNEFVRDARRVLDEVGAAKGKRLELSAWCGGTPAQSAYAGTDAETWIREGLLDSVVWSVGATSVDPAIIAAANAHGCRCIPGFHYHHNTLKDAVKYVYPKGTDGIALWDSDAIPASELWPAMRRMGHRKEFFAMAKTPPERPIIGLKDVDGSNMEAENGRFGLFAAAYSCG